MSVISYLPLAMFPDSSAIGHSFTPPCLCTCCVLFLGLSSIFLLVDLPVTSRRSPHCCPSPALAEHTSLCTPRVLLLDVPAESHLFTCVFLSSFSFHCTVCTQPRKYVAGEQITALWNARPGLPGPLSHPFFEREPCWGKSVSSQVSFHNPESLKMLTFNSLKRPGVPLKYGYLAFLFSF